MPILIVIVSGLPGAGKSTLISELMKHVEMLSVTEGSTLFRLEHICFDNIFDCSRGLRPWSAESPAEWKHSRGVMMATINETVERLRKGRSERDVGEKAVVFVDDNFQLRSMRKEVFVLARKRMAVLKLLMV
jgi:tRNA uridine 5-carbamoylmethylation protein Kti12